MKVSTIALSILTIILSLTYSIRLKASTKFKLATLRNKYREFSRQDIKDLLNQLKTGPYRFDSKIGSGGFGQVFKITRASGKNENFAFKIIDYKSGKGMNSETEKLAIIEIKFLDEFKNNQHVTQLIEWKNDENDKIITMVLELMDSDLMQCLDSLSCYDATIRNNKLKVIKTLLEGLLTIHQKGIAHLDIKPENIMIKNKQFKYGDFGLAVKLSEREIMNSVRGTPRYIDLNVYKKVNPTDPGLGLKSDLYSLGLTFLEIIDRKLFLCLNKKDNDDCNSTSFDLKKNLKESLNYEMFGDFCNSQEFTIYDKEDDFLNCLAVNYMLTPYHKRKEIHELIKIIDIFEDRDRLIREEEERKIREEEEKRIREEEEKRIREEEEERRIAEEQYKNRQEQYKNRQEQNQLKREAANTQKEQNKKIQDENVPNSIRKIAEDIKRSNLNRKQNYELKKNNEAQTNPSKEIDLFDRLVMNKDKTTKPKEDKKMTFNPITGKIQIPLRNNNNPYLKKHM